jgi:uncharacterized protein YneF (UPF0154 family)
VGPYGVCENAEICGDLMMMSFIFGVLMGMWLALHIKIKIKRSYWSVSHPLTALQIKELTRPMGGWYSSGVLTQGRMGGSDLC